MANNKILIVDDVAFMRMTLRDILVKGGYEIVGEAEDGTEAIEKYKKLKPDVTMLDITMPKTDGINAIKGIKEIDPAAKVIVCSAMGQKPIVVKAIHAGAADYIIKPFQHERVLLSVSKVLSAAK